MAKCINYPGYLIARVGVNPETLQKFLIKYYNMKPEEAFIKAVETVECINRNNEIDDVQLLMFVQDIASTSKDEWEFWSVLDDLLTREAIRHYIRLLKERGVPVFTPEQLRKLEERSIKKKPSSMGKALLRTK